MESFNIWLSLAIAIFAFLATVIGVYYTRNSYLFTLKNFEKDKSRGEKARHYYETYINKPPSFKPSMFLKKIDSDELNESVILPYEFTDFLIKEYPSQYFYFASRLSKGHKYFTFSNTNQKIEIYCKIKSILLREICFFILYVLFATTATILGAFGNQIISSYYDNQYWSALYLILIGIVLSIAFMFVCLHKTTQLENVRMLIKELRLPLVKNTRLTKYVKSIKHIFSIFNKRFNSENRILKKHEQHR